MASEITLWREVNLSRLSVEYPRSAIDSTIEKLAALRLKFVRELNLDGWSELTDVGLKVLQNCSILGSRTPCQSFQKTLIAFFYDKFNAIFY